MLGVLEVSVCCSKGRGLRRDGAGGVIGEQVLHDDGEIQICFNTLGGIMNQMLWAHRTFIIVLVSLSVAGLWGQANTSVRGTVTDQSGALIQKAQLTLINTATGLERKTESGDNGAYEFLQVVPGTYRLRVEMAGFKRYEASDLSLQVNSPASVNVVLEVGGVTESVAVTS
jgi:hypothetical protein